MNIQYQRNLKNSYMVVIEPGQPLNLDGQLAEKMMERQQIPQVMSRFSAALFHACKQVPCFAEGTFDKDKLYNDELG